MISEDAIILLVAVISESFDEVLLLLENPLVYKDEQKLDLWE